MSFVNGYFFARWFQTFRVMTEMKHHNFMEELKCAFVAPASKKVLSTQTKLPKVALAAT